VRGVKRGESKTPQHQFNRSMHKASQGKGVVDSNISPKGASVIDLAYAQSLLENPSEGVGW